MHGCETGVYMAPLLQEIDGFIPAVSDDWVFCQEKTA